MTYNKPRFSESRTTGCVSRAILHKYVLSHKTDGLFKKHPKTKRKSLFISPACVHVCAHAHKKIVNQPSKTGFVLWSFRMKVVNSIFACFWFFKLFLKQMFLFYRTVTFSLVVLIFGIQPKSNIADLVYNAASLDCSCTRLPKTEPKQVLRKHSAPFSP